MDTQQNTQNMYTQNINHTGVDTQQIDYSPNFIENNFVQQMENQENCYITGVQN